MIEINEKDAQWLIKSLRERVEFLEEYSSNVVKENKECRTEMNNFRVQLSETNLLNINIEDEKIELSIKNKELVKELEQVKTLREQALKTVNELNRELEELKGKYELATTINKMGGEKSETKVIGVGRPKKQ